MHHPCASILAAFLPAVSKPSRAKRAAGAGCKSIDLVDIAGSAGEIESAS
jgi:hypothetical protein